MLFSRERVFPLVESHAIGHAVKKLLMAGQRGAKDRATDLEEAITAIQRAMEGA